MYTDFSHIFCDFESNQIDMQWFRSSTAKGRQTGSSIFAITQMQSGQLRCRIVIVIIGNRELRACMWLLFRVHMLRKIRMPCGANADARLDDGIVFGNLFEIYMNGTA